MGLVAQDFSGLIAATMLVAVRVAAHMRQVVATVAAVTELRVEMAVMVLLIRGAVVQDVALPLVVQ